MCTYLSTFICINVSNNKIKFNNIMVVLKVANSDKYLKCLNEDTDTIEFTTNEDEAQKWLDEWRANTRIGFLKKHINLGNIKATQEDEDLVNRLIPAYYPEFSCEMPTL